MAATISLSKHAKVNQGRFLVLVMVCGYILHYKYTAHLSQLIFHMLKCKFSVIVSQLTYVVFARDTLLRQQILN